MGSLTIKAIRRREGGGKLQVQTNGGWMNWNMVGEDSKRMLYEHPATKRYVRGDQFDNDPYVSDAFLCVLAEQPPPEDGDISDVDPTGKAPEGQPEGEDGQLEIGQGEGTPTGEFKMPAQGEFDGAMQSQGEGEGGGSGADDCFATKLPKDEDGNVGEPELIDFTEPFLGRFMAVGEKLGQAVYEQSVAMSVTKTAEAVAALANDMVHHVATETTALEKRLVSKIDAIPKGEGGSGGAIVKVQIVTPKEIREIDGLAHRQMPKLLKLCSMGLHTYLPGPPGTGKSHAAEQVAKLLEWEYASISLGPTTPESRLWGGMDANGKFHEPPFVAKAKYARDNPDSGAVFCLDEIDNGHPGIIATLNSALANRWFTTPEGEFVSLGNNFVIVAAANTYGTGATAEFSGRNRLDAATLDRFAFLPWDTDKDVESTLVHAHLAEHPKGKFIADDWLKVWNLTRTKVDQNGLKVFVTMRGAINGAILLAQDMPVKEVWGMVLGNKLPEDQARKINPL